MQRERVTVQTLRLSISLPLLSPPRTLPRNDHPPSHQNQRTTTSPTSTPINHHTTPLTRRLPSLAPTAPIPGIATVDFSTRCLLIAASALSRPALAGSIVEPAASSTPIRTWDACSGSMRGTDGMFGTVSGVQRDLKASTISRTVGWRRPVFATGGFEHEDRQVDEQRLCATAQQFHQPSITDSCGRSGGVYQKRIPRPAISSPITAPGASRPRLHVRTLSF